MNQQLTLEEARQLHQKHGTDWICPYCHSSMYVKMKLIKHPDATKQQFPCVFKCLLCDKEEKYWVMVDNEYIIRDDRG